MNDYPSSLAREPAPSVRTAAIAVYALYAASFIVGITYFAGIIVAYVKRDDAVGTWLESHYRWQIRTFWYTLIWGILGALTSIILIGFLILGAAAIWFIYRIVKGWMRLLENKPMYVGP